jgi:hypothetical protein
MHGGEERNARNFNWRIEKRPMEKIILVGMWNTIRTFTLKMYNV